MIMNGNVVRRFATKEPTLCAVCRRRAEWLGYNNGGRSAVIWLCNEDDCIAAGKVIYNMPQQMLDAYEATALLEAGDKAGGYLDEIGITDLARLDRDQWREFLRRIVVGYEEVLRRKILNNEGPF
jgi:hypothetical protein